VTEPASQLTRNPGCYKAQLQPLAHLSAPPRISRQLMTFADARRIPLRGTRITISLKTPALMVRYLLGTTAGIYLARSRESSANGKSPTGRSRPVGQPVATWMSCALAKLGDPAPCERASRYRRRSWTTSSQNATGARSSQRLLHHGPGRRRVRAVRRTDGRLMNGRHTPAG
jgi:hypothetical protein